MRQRWPSLELFSHRLLSFAVESALKKFRRKAPRLRWFRGDAGGFWGRVRLGRSLAQAITSPAITHPQPSPASHPTTPNNHQHSSPSPEPRSFATQVIFAPLPKRSEGNGGEITSSEGQRCPNSSKRSEEYVGAVVSVATSSLVVATEGERQK